jgi:BarA-like signal transduction histidine kinase
LPQQKLTYLITALKGRATDVLYSIPTNVTYEKTLQALEDHFGDQHVAAAFRSQLKMRTQRAGKFLLVFAIAIEQLAHHAYPTLP